VKRIRYILTIVFSLLCLVATIYVLTAETRKDAPMPEESWTAPTSQTPDSSLIGFWEDSVKRILPPDAVRP